MNAKSMLIDRDVHLKAINDYTHNREGNSKLVVSIPIFCCVSVLAPFPCKLAYQMKIVNRSTVDDKWCCSSRICFELSGEK